MFIIVWKDSHRDPFVDVDSRNFKESYYTYEEAKVAAEKILEQEGPQSPWYFDYKIYEEV
jgi:hypothetical protein